MGCDVRVILPNDVRVSDVARVMGILAGLKKEITEEGYLRVPGAKAESSQGCPDLCNIELHPPKGQTLVDDEDFHTCFYHFECFVDKDLDCGWGDIPQGSYRLISGRSTPFWAAMAVRLTQFFGGWVDINDCDESEVDYHFECPRPHNSPEDGEPWENFQEEMKALEPITDQEMLDVHKKHELYETEHISRLQKEIKEDVVSIIMQDVEDEVDLTS